MRKSIPYRYLSLRRTVAQLLVLPLTLGYLKPAFAAPATPEQIAAHTQLANDANAPLADWAAGEARGAKNWTMGSGLPSDLYLDAQKPPSQQFTTEQLEIARDTQMIIDQVKPGRIGTFIESANPAVLTENGVYRWDELGLSGLKDPDNVKRLLDQSLEQGITDIRVGIDLGQVDPARPETMDPFIRTFLIPMWERGMLPIVTLDWFANMEPMRKTNKDGSTLHQFSYLNNPKFIEEREKLADMVSKKVFAAMKEFNQENSKKSKPAREANVAYTLINETHTKAAFERNFWHESQTSGVTWSSPELQKLYIPGLINIGRASVRMRAAIEKNRHGEKVLFMANEAMTPAYYPTHDGYLRFAVLRLVMGDAVFTEANLQALLAEPLDQLKARLDQKETQLKAQGGNISELEGMIKLYVFGNWNDTPEKKEGARRMLLSMLQRYQRDVAQLKADHKITMRHRTIFGGDFYGQSEFVPPKPVPVLALEEAKNQGEKLKSDLQVRSDEDFMKMLREAAQKAEQKTGVKIWDENWTSRDKVDFERLLTMEDAVMMDLLIGFRYALWGLRTDADLVVRQKRLGLDKSMKIFEEAHDEFRADNFLNMLLKDNAKMLYTGLGAKTSNDLYQALLAAAKDTRDGGPVIKFGNRDTLRDILNKDSRRIMMRLFGLKNERFIGFLPPHYPVQIRAGVREGLAPIFKDYAKAAGVLHVSIMESGTPYYPWAERVHTQMLMSAVASARSENLVLVSYHLGPLVHTIGWAPSPLAGDMTTNNSINESGIFKFKDLGNGRFEYSLAAWADKQPWFKLFADPVNASLAKFEQRKQQIRAAAPRTAVAADNKSIDNSVVQLAARAAQAKPAVSCSKVRVSGI